MATTAEIMIGGTLLLTYWFTIAVMYFAGNAVLGPVFNFVASFPIHPALQQGLWEISWLPTAFFAFLLLFGIVGTISFFIIIGRRQVTPYDY
jgi:hypothetical protein